MSQDVAPGSPGEGLQMWTIYRRPKDFPDVPYVLRGWVIAGGYVQDTGALGLGDTLEEVRGMVPAGLVRMERADTDDPVIVETWL